MASSSFALVSPLSCALPSAMIDVNHLFQTRKLFFNEPEISGANHSNIFVGMSNRVKIFAVDVCANRLIDRAQPEFEDGARGCPLCNRMDCLVASE